MSSAAILNASQHDPHLLAAKDVKNGNIVIGIWEPITNVNDHQVQEAAKYAVAEHNKKTNDHLIYGCVLCGAIKIMCGGVYYCLTIEARDGHLLPPKVGLYQAIVFSAVTNPIDRKLEFFVHLGKN